VIYSAIFVKWGFFLKLKKGILTKVKSMKIIVAHNAPDMDAITSVWLIKKFLPGWDKANIQFVPAGSAIGRTAEAGAGFSDPVEKIGKDSIIQVDTGLGPLDHHQTQSDKVSAASLTFDYVINQMQGKLPPINREKLEALERIIRYVVDIDHFKEVFRKDALADYHDFSVVNILDGLKLQKQNDDRYYVDFISECLDALLHDFENKVWAEREIANRGIEFETRWGKGLGLETINDSIVKMAQLMGYVVVIRRDPRKGYVRIKARPDAPNEKGVDLTLTAEKLKKMDPQATWFLHVSNKMLLNGTPKNPKMKPTKLSLNDIIEVLKTI